jgi:hypothetical protein
MKQLSGFVSVIVEFVSFVKFKESKLLCNLPNKLLKLVASPEERKDTTSLNFKARNKSENS